MFKCFRFSAAILLIIFLAGTIYSFTPSPHIRQDEPEINSPQHWLEIRDLSYQNFDQDQRYLSLKAERFSIQKKKVGFFRIGLVSIGVFVNSQIDFYLDQDAEPGPYQSTSYNSCFSAFSRMSGVMNIVLTS